LLASNNNSNNRKHDTASDESINLKFMLSSPNLFYAAQLGEAPVKDKVDSMINTITFDTAQNVHLVLVSAADLGLRNLADIQWEEILDSALAHGYQWCPAQTGPELLLWAQYTSTTQGLSKLHPNVPVFIGMPEMCNTKTQKVHGKQHKYWDGYVFCLKSDGRHKGYKLGYTSTGLDAKPVYWSSNDMFVFVKSK
ncbi:MAG TPA: hypothetical protein VN922_06770, partial [Bacteroidia bacterium]|nr:hypothetical protein [Bacteroidia bacterium]